MFLFLTCDAGLNSVSMDRKWAIIKITQSHVQKKYRQKNILLKFIRYMISHVQVIQFLPSSIDL